MAGISHLVCAFLPVDTDGNHGVNAERDSEDLFEQNDWTKNVTKDPLLEQGLGECERHANGWHEKVSNGQVDQEDGQVRLGSMAHQVDENDDQIGDDGWESWNDVDDAHEYEKRIVSIHSVVGRRRVGRDGVGCVA